MVGFASCKRGFYGSLLSVDFVSSVLVTSSIGFGGGVVAMVQPIHRSICIICIAALSLLMPTILANGVSAT
jgi:hypothetical protein